MTFHFGILLQITGEETYDSPSEGVVPQTVSAMGSAVGNLMGGNPVVGNPVVEMDQWRPSWSLLGDRERPQDRY